MKKISITQLETARRNPTAFAKSMNEPSSQSFSGGYPKSLRWLNAICKYHETNKVEDAFASIENGFSSRKDTAKNRNEVNDFMVAIDNYVKEHKKRKLNFIKGRELINIELSTKLKLSGQIPIINMKTPKGFSAYFISKNIPLWESELRFPIVQEYIANHLFSCNISDVEVGILDIYTGRILERTYSPIEIQDAVNEMKNIGNAISLII